MKPLTLVAREDELCIAWAKAFSGTDDVRIYRGDFREVVDQHDCLVSPANSFGMMDGGIDKAYADYFGEGLQQAVQRHIAQHYSGEQPVGSCLLVYTGQAAPRYLAHTPTMRVPMNIQGTDHVYVAMRALLNAVRNTDITSVLCPGLGTGAGGVPFDVAARHMRLAYDSIASPPQQISWPVADAIHNSLGIGRP